jgi:hypothetical protein
VSYARQYACRVLRKRCWDDVTLPCVALPALLLTCKAAMDIAHVADGVILILPCISRNCTRTCTLARPKSCCCCHY